MAVEGLRASREATGWVMREDEAITVRIYSDNPIGHKVALKDFVEGDTVTSCNTGIGKVVPNFVS